MLAVLDQLAVSFDLPILDWIQANLKREQTVPEASTPDATAPAEGG